MSQNANANVDIAGVGMIPFANPGASRSYPEMGAAATRSALDDADVVTLYQAL